jgi:hypothetical protein
MALAAQLGQLFLLLTTLAVSGLPTQNSGEPSLGAATRYRRKFLAEHRLCAFCGGRRQATTIEHCPPMAMFQHRLWPEGFEFPACEHCNQSTDDHDLLIAMLARMDPFAKSGNADGKLEGLIHMANRQYPGLLKKMAPSANEARRRNRELGLEPAPGQTHQETGIVKVPVELQNAVGVLGRKLAKGVFYRSAGKIFPDEGCLLMRWFTNSDLFRDGKYVAFDQLKELAGEVPPTVRGGKFLGDQFEYKLSMDPEGNVFALQARFGGAFGLVVFGSAVPGLLESGVTRLREETSRSGPFTILQSPTLA